MRPVKGMTLSQPVPLPRLPDVPSARFVNRGTRLDAGLAIEDPVAALHVGSGMLHGIDQSDLYHFDLLICELTSLLSIALYQPALVRAGKPAKAVATN